MIPKNKIPIRCVLPDILLEFDTLNLEFAQVATYPQLELRTIGTKQ